MTSPLQQAVAGIRLADYVSVIMITAVGYDYILTFSEEVEYVWSKRWTWVSTLFVLGRYSGICSAMFHAIWWNSAVNPTAQMWAHSVVLQRYTDYGHFQGNILFIVGAWCFWIFICSADLVMILRIWALYTRSKFILGTLLAFYAIEVIGFFINYVVDDSDFPSDPIIGTAQVLGSVTCVWDRVSPVWDNLQTVMQLTLGVWMCLLIIFQFIKESVQMYKMTRRFRLSPYQKILVWEGLVYFIIVLAFALISQLANAGLIPENGWWVLCGAIQQTLPFAVFPRFVLSLRKLYARDLGGRRGEDIDTAFGLISVRYLATMSGIAFADTEQNEERADGMEMEMKCQGKV